MLKSFIPNYYTNDSRNFFFYIYYINCFIANSENIFILQVY